VRVRRRPNCEAHRRDEGVGRGRADRARAGSAAAWRCVEIINQ
jgi:hypothetical protein